MSGLLLVIAVLMGLLVILLAVPVAVAFRFEGIAAFTGQFTIHWLFGLVRFRIQVPTTRKLPTPEPETEPHAAERHERHAKGGAHSNFLSVLRQVAFRQRVYRFIKDLARAAHLQQLGLRVRLGLGDPADTGHLWAILGPLNALAQNLRNAEVNIEPEFMDAVFEYQAHGRLQLVPLQFLILAVAFALSPPALRAWRSLKGRHA